jgi:hypothetical protein
METPPITPAPEEPRKNNTILYIAIGALILCCCCVGVIVFYQYLGDPLIDALR